MHISPVGLAAETEDEVIRLSKAITRVTHNHPERIKDAEAVAGAIFMARNGCTIRDKITCCYYTLDFTIDKIKSTYQFNETCQETVPQVFEVFLRLNPLMML